MNIEFFKEKLKAKENGLLAEISRLEETGANTSATEPSEELTNASQTLIQVRAALDRADHGAYGHCLACGRAIELERLEEIPWTLNCVEDQKKQDQAEIPYIAPTL
jgi:RNA polymerase-binding transcription factor DksA